MTGNPDAIVVQAWARLMKAQQLALAAVERDLKAAGLPPLVWYDVLLEVERAGGQGLRPFELERAMLLAQYNLSRLIDRIERAGYVERRNCEDDGRGQMIVATGSGKAMRRKMWPVYARAITAVIGKPLSLADAQTLAGLLGRIIDGQRND
jgi:DNA-binding MarR family transcriptional regulator